MLTRAVVVNRGGGVLLLREAVQTASAASRRRPLHHLTHYASAAAAVGAAAEMPMGSSRGLPRPLVAGAEAVAALWWRPLSSQAATNHHAVEETEASALPHQREQPQPQPGPALVPQQQYQYVQQDPLQDGAMAPREGLEQKVSVMAFYVGQKLDLISVMHDVW